MAVSQSPKALAKLNSNTPTVEAAEAIKASLESVKEKYDKIKPTYQKQAKLVDEIRNEVATADGGVGKKILALQVAPYRDEPKENETQETMRSLWDSVKYEPNTFITELIPQHNKKVRYEKIFALHPGIIDKKLKPKLTEAITQLNALNTAGYQANLKEIQRNNNIMIKDLNIFKQIVTKLDAGFKTRESIIYNSPVKITYREGKSFYEVETLAAQTDTIITALTDINNILDQATTVDEDVLSRVALKGSGLEQDAQDPNIFNIDLPDTKESWGIKFTYKTFSDATNYVESKQSKTYAKNKKNETNEERQAELDTSKELIGRNIISTSRDFYFQLLPAIKSNMPTSGGSDVPGAMPGLQFRIENNIVKHKIPGFAPVYQPIGVDCIKCTMVGMFAGREGADFSNSLLDETTGGLVKTGSTNNIYSLNKIAEAFGGSTSPTAADVGQTPRKAYGNAVLSEDAFNSAQEFYNNVVAPGREVEVEINLRKGTGVFPGGVGGALRDKETGNPKFKALIKRIDIYYVRRDRCWFIMDLEITDAGLIGDECVNLTNVIDEAIDIFDNVVAVKGLNLAELEKCFGKGAIEAKMTGPRSGETFVINPKTGESYFKNAEGELLTDRTYPLSFRETYNILSQNLEGGTIKGLKGISQIDNVSYWNTAFNENKTYTYVFMLYLASLYEPKKSGDENSKNEFSNFALGASTLGGVNLRLPGKEGGRRWRYKKTTGKWVKAKSETLNLVDSGAAVDANSKTLKELIDEQLIDYSQILEPKKALDEYVGLLDLPETTQCGEELNRINNPNFTGTRLTNEDRAPRIGTNRTPIVAPEITNDSLDEAEDLEVLNTLIDTESTADNIEQREEITERIKAGDYNNIIATGLNHYMQILDVEKEDEEFNSSVLSPKYVDTLKRGVLNDKLRTFNRGITFEVNNIKEVDTTLFEVKIKATVTPSKEFRTVAFFSRDFSAEPKDVIIKLKRFRKTLEDDATEDSFRITSIRLNGGEIDWSE